jgi:hypothetical protein
MTQLIPNEKSVPALGGLTNPAHFYMLRGRADILRMQAVLANLCINSEQIGATDYLEYFLSSRDNLKKTPHLVIVASRSNAEVFTLRAEEIQAAVLVYEYRLLGLSSRIFTTSDYDGSKAVIAHPQIRPKISSLVCRYLMRHGAWMVQLTFAGEFEVDCNECFHALIADRKKRLWTTQTREVGATIALQKTVDETLATMGKHTRRNLRYYRRKAEVELSWSFATEVKQSLTRAELKELNEASTHPVDDLVLDHRSSTLKALDGMFCVGVRSPAGQWVSLLAGRRHHGVSEIDWQMNRGGLEKYSVGTVIRAYLIEHEIEIGTTRLYFEGGTPHSMRHAFLSEKATDMVVLKRSIFLFLLQKSVQRLGPGKNFLLQTLSNSTLKWELH